MRHLARLLGAPGRELHALELARLESPRVGAAAVADGSMSADGLGDAGPVLDAEAKAAYRQKLQEICQESSPKRRDGTTLSASLACKPRRRR